MDSAAVGNHNKVKVMATQLLAKFEENAPTQPAGLKRQVRKKLAESFCGFIAGGWRKRRLSNRGKMLKPFGCSILTLIVVCFSLEWISLMSMFMAGLHDGLLF